jgi:hypothetical protein
MRFLSTGAAKYRMRVLSAIKFVRLPQPSITMTCGVFSVSWICGQRIAIIVQNIDNPSYFNCLTFFNLKPDVDFLEINLDALDGPARLVEFLDAIAVWFV